MLSRIDVITLFPDWIGSLKQLGLTGRAIADGTVELHCWNPRDYAEGVHRSVDDRPYGGGPGMVMRPEPLAKAIEAARGGDAGARVGCLSPQGRTLEQGIVQELAARERLILVCGRYEGIDERVMETLVDEEWSIGDFVLSGGEPAAAVMIDAVVRLLPGVLGHECSAEQDSFSDGLLDCPHYTRPESWRGHAVPEILLSGDHARIERWRRAQAIERTRRRRPDLLSGRDLDADDEQILAEFSDAKRDRR
ncbi:MULTISPECIES: tRNA (guanosine(37)-N1)-methyltransferase TrmD [unclassified Wenzhouxiangella]|uniref:tRNA (guanosine(37)-N1)-methyltransferase TrmD n=1 Tax=unclassified Wenzhouxiangella TaxID=2613841 RepID=UPI000E327926|nr:MULTISPECIES: tRNA (guanosine(37)-N1)-methyltransferase TrmD [unclassified Wenzhouxiangella]RFF26396.1 tRNA (guanosine(37)-N1)-methyltransferase TrmD [Wenzhouxiangella sp. 15181]RFP67331.1 tRNA (guanosine(37)-N1)-methyltransferase TrmD [Wenzhouxiangella sp. 15190]